MNTNLFVKSNRFTPFTLRKNRNMKTEITNPFITRGYAGLVYYCNRKDETKRLVGDVDLQR